MVPLCANIHMAGSMITITACATAVCLMNQIPISLSTLYVYLFYDFGHCHGSISGAPGGSIMTALPFMYMIFGVEAGDPGGSLCAIMVALYITQDSFGTACNVSGDNAIGVIVETIYQKFIKKPIWKPDRLAARGRKGEQSCPISVFLTCLGQT